MITFDPDDPDDMRRAARELFAEPAPRDIVPGQPITLDEIRRRSAMYDQPYTITIPGEPAIDDNGNPYITEPRTESGRYGPTVISQADADRLEISDGDYPGIFVARH